MRGVKALTAQQLADLTRPRACVGLGENPRLVLGRERPPLGLLDQLRIRHPATDPLWRGAPADPKAQLGYASLVFGAGGSLIRRPSSIRARVQHVRRSPFCRVAGAVARPGSHRTVLVLFTHGSSGRRVVNPAAGRLSTLAYPHSSANCSWVGATISSCQARCRSTSERRPRWAKYRGRSALSTCGMWLSAHRDLRPE